MRIFHLATRADWDDALAVGRYTISTRGRTLAEEGFIHASRGDQWQGVRQRFYADVTEPLVLLVIDTALVDVPVVEEAVPGGGTETFPHLYGALDVAAVVQVIALDGAPGDAPPGLAAPPGPATTATNAALPPRPTGPTSFSQAFRAEVMHQLVLGCIVIGLGFVGLLLGLAAGAAADSDWPGLIGALAGLAVGTLVAMRVHRARVSRLAP